MVSLLKSLLLTLVIAAASFFVTVRSAQASIVFSIFKNVSIFKNFTFFRPFVCGTDTVADIDGNVYSTVLVGTQCWMASNMMTSHYPDGTAITRGDTGTGGNWTGSDAGLYAYPSNGGSAEETLANIISNNLGFVYQWSAMMHGAASCNGTATQPACAAPIQGICPTGWHVPSHYELTLLERGVCTTGTCATDFPYDLTTTGARGTTEGTKLQSGGSSGFNVVLPGIRGASGAFIGRNSYTYLSSSLENSGNVLQSWYRRFDTGVATIATYNGGPKAYALSVRCVKSNAYNF
jgi:uncharacterized protein (TIGR02145 family)